MNVNKPCVLLNQTQVIHADLICKIKCLLFYIYHCYIFSSLVAYKQSRRWSKCTQAKLEKDFKEGNLDHCLKNIPETLQKVGNTPVCGNFFVEEG